MLIANPVDIQSYHFLSHSIELLFSNKCRLLHIYSSSYKATRSQSNLCCSIHLVRHWTLSHSCMRTNKRIPVLLVLSWFDCTWAAITISIGHCLYVWVCEFSQCHWLLLLLLLVYCLLVCCRYVYFICHLRWHLKTWMQKFSELKTQTRRDTRQDNPTQCALDMRVPYLSFVCTNVCGVLW